LYTVKEVSEIMGISAHTLRYYDNEDLFPYVSRDENNVRLFSEHDLEWVKIVQCLRDTDMPLADVKRYVQFCLEGDNTAKERYHMILKQKEKAEQEVVEMQKRVEILKKKEEHYKELLHNNMVDDWNPENSNKARNNY